MSLDTDTNVKRYSEALQTSNSKDARTITGGTCPNGSVRDGNNCTISDQQTGPITINNGGTLVIENNGKINVSNGKNDGIKVNGTSGHADITNKGTISGTDNGILLKGDNKGTITGNIKNEGIITSTGYSGININSNSTAKTISNTGTIQGQNGIAIWNSGKVETLTNNGLIEGD